MLPAYAYSTTETDVRAAALQYVRKISGFRAPAAHNAVAFETAVDTVAAVNKIANRTLASIEDSASAVATTGCGW